MYRIAAIALGAAFAVLLALVIGMQLGGSGAGKPVNTQAANANSLQTNQTLAASQAGFAAAEGQTVPSISVMGEGKALAAPDTVKLDLGVEVTNKSLTEARDEAASKMNAVVQKLKEMGIADKDIQTVNYSVYPQQDWDQKPPVVTGFQVSQIVDVTIRDVNKVGSIVDAVVGVGATNIGGISFTINDPKPLQQQAREQAMADAKAKAEQLAKLAGVSLGKVITISESGGYTPPPIYQRMDAAAGAAAAPSAATNIQPGQLEVQTTVSVVYSIQ